MNTLQRKIMVTDGVEVTSIWAVPPGYPEVRRVGVILAHGAGNDMHGPFLVHLHEQLARRGALTVRFNFPYKERGGRAPDRAPLLEATWRAVIEAVRADERLAPEQLFLAGKSMGGRIASHLAAAGEPCAGLILLGYPLHPARKPERLRASHLPGIHCPMLFVEGTRDPLCDRGLLDEVLRHVQAPVTVHNIEGADHSFRLPRRLGRSEQDVWCEIVDAVAEWTGLGARTGGATSP